MKLVRVPKGGLNITLEPKNPTQGHGEVSWTSWKYPRLTALCRDLRRDTIGFPLPGFDKTGKTFDRNMEMP